MDDPVYEALNRAADEVTPQDLDVIVAYIRQQRKNFEAGVKPKKDSVDLVKALQIKPKIIEGPVRRL